MFIDLTYEVVIDLACTMLIIDFDLFSKKKSRDNSLCFYLK